MNLLETNFAFYIEIRVKTDLVLNGLRNTNKFTPWVIKPELKLVVHPKSRENVL